MSEPHADSAPGGEGLLRQIVDRLPSMVAYWDSELICRFANQAYLTWFGKAPEEFFGKHIETLLGPSLYAKNLPYIQAALRGEPQQFEREIPDPKGGPSRHSLAHYIPHVEEGRVRGFYVLVNDISEVKRAQLALRDSEERFSRTIDEAPIGMALVGLDGRFLRVNRVLCEMLGYTSEELVALTFQEITHPEDLDADLALAGQLARGEIPRYQLGKRYIRKDRSVIDINLSGSAVRRPDGTLLHFVAQIEDVTARKRAADEERFLAEVGAVLAASLEYEETLSAIATLAVRQLADYCVIDTVDPKGEITRLRAACRDAANSRTCEALETVRLDRQRPHLVSTTLETRQPHLVKVLSAEAIARMIQSEEHGRAVLAMRPHSLMTVPLVARGQLAGVIGFVRSVGASPFDEQDLQLAERLARRAALSIDNARLYREARRATLARDEVIGIVAHDLRNPLNNLLMYAGLLRRTPAGDASAQQAAATIERSARRMNRLIQDLLDVTRIEAGRLRVEQERVSTHATLRDFIDSQQPLASGAELTLRLEARPDLPALWADPDRFLQVLENLVGNAIKFTPQRGVITVAAEPCGDELVFRVSDTGRGIREEDLPHVFDRFWQGRGAERQGAGLGLQVVKGVVEAHCGRVWVQSVVGKGTTVFFTLPIARGETVRSGPEAPRGP